DVTADLHHVGRAVARRELHHAEPVARRLEAHGLGVDRNRAGVARKVGQVAAMQADGHAVPCAPSNRAALITVDSPRHNADGARAMTSVDLGDHLRAVVTELVKSGRYQSEAEVLREGVRLVLQREVDLAARDASIARGVADAGALRAKPAATVFD